jgi:hypothetical protein
VTEAAVETGPVEIRLAETQAVVETGVVETRAVQPPLSQFLATLSPMPGRSLRNVSLSYKHVGWSLVVDDNEDATDHIMVTRKKRPFKIASRMVPKDDSTLALRTVNTFLQFLKAWPWPMPRVIKAADKVQENILQAALQHTNPGAFVHRLGPVQRFESDVLSIAIPFLDSATGQHASCETYVQPDQTIGLPTPKLPLAALIANDGLGFKTIERGMYSYKISVDAKDGAEEDQRKAQDILRYLSLRCYNVVANEAQMEKLVSFEREAIKLPKSSAPKSGARKLSAPKSDAPKSGAPKQNASAPKPGAIKSALNLYRGFQLYQTKKELKSIVIRPARAVMADTGINKLYNIRIKSLNASRVTPVINVLVHTFTHLEDVRYSIIEAAKAADQVNSDIAAGLPPSSQCYCDDDATKKELHACEACSLLCICNERQLDRLGRWACRPCILKQTKRAQLDQRQGESLAMTFVRASITNSIRRESKQTGLRREEEDQLLEAAIVKLRGRFEGCGPSQYLDGFTGCMEEVMHEVPMPLGVNPITPRHHCTTPSVDALFPRMPSEVFPSKYFNHAEGNLAIISRGLQYAKFTYLPGCLALIAQYLKLGDRRIEAKRNLVQDLHPFHVLSYKHGYQRNTRAAGEVVQAEFEQQQAQYISGKLIAKQDDHLEAKTRRVSDRLVPTSVGQLIWDKSTTTRLWKICFAMHHKYHKNFLAAPDGAPWPFAEDMPTDWRWNSWATLCVERRERMRVFCNKGFEMKDTAETIFLECMYQHCTDDPQYAGLGLPLHPWIGSPLRASVAHKHHRYGMFSGWPIDARLLSDRDDSANNMLIESWLRNSAKGGMHETYYDKTADLIRSVVMPKAFYDPTLELPVNVVASRPSTLDDGDVIDVPGEGFDEDALGGEEDPAKSSFADAPDVEGEDQDGVQGGVQGGDEDEGGDAATGVPRPVVGVTTEPEDQAMTGMIGEDVETLHGKLMLTKNQILSDKDIGEKFLNDPRILSLLSKAQDLDDGEEEHVRQGKSVMNELLAILNEGRDD